MIIYKVGDIVKLRWWATDNSLEELCGIIISTPKLGLWKVKAFKDDLHHYNVKVEWLINLSNNDYAKTTWRKRD